MAKKTQRPNLPQETLERARREMTMQPSAPVSTEPAGTTGRTSVAKIKTAAAPVDLRSQYMYVVTDLENMAMLAGLLLLVLVVLSFIL